MVRALGLVAMMAAVARADDLEDLKKQLAALQQTVSDLQVAQATQDATAAPTPSEPVFDVHGFIDMGLQKVFTNDGAGFESTAATFVLGNVNLYFMFHPVAHWSALTEIRFTNEPSGTATDPANGIGDDHMRWGAIVLERAYIQYEHSRELGLRVGEFLTPFGIWNVDHGSPVVIPIVRPESMTAELFPMHQVGIELYGENTDWAPGRWTLGYHAYVSNGRTPGQVDPTNDKMFGGRLELSTTRPYRMAFGLSGMIGQYSDATSGMAEQVAYDERGISADGSVDFTALRLRAEVTVRDIHFQPARHALLDTGTLEPNEAQFDAYVLAAYRIPETRFEPYLYTEAFHQYDDIGDIQLGAAAGLNIYFAPQVQLKLQALHNKFYQSDGLHLHASGVYETFVGAKLVMGL